MVTTTINILITSIDTTGQGVTYSMVYCVWLFLIIHILISDVFVSPVRSSSLRAINTWDLMQHKANMSN